MEPEDISFSPANLAKLIGLTEAGTINSSVAKEVFEQVFEKDVDPESYVEEHGLKTVNDEGALEEVLKEVIDKVKYDFDVILLDTPPSLEILTSNALACATDYIVPIFSGSQYGMYGVVELQRYIDSLKRINPQLSLLGALLVRMTNAS